MQQLPCRFLWAGRWEKCHLSRKSPAASCFTANLRRRGSQRWKADSSWSLGARPRICISDKGQCNNTTQELKLAEERTILILTAHKRQFNPSRQPACTNLLLGRSTFDLFTKGGASSHVTETIEVTVRKHFNLRMSFCVWLIYIQLYFCYLA